MPLGAAVKLVITWPTSSSNEDVLPSRSAGTPDTPFLGSRPDLEFCSGHCNPRRESQQLLRQFCGAHIVSHFLPLKEHKQIGELRGDILRRSRPVV